MAFFDNHIVDANAPTYLYVQANLSWEAIVNRAVSTKKAKYGSVAEEPWASFTPLACSTEGVLHCEYAAYQQWMARCLASKWQKPFSVIMACVRVCKPTCDHSFCRPSPSLHASMDLWTWSTQWGSHQGWLLIIFIYHTFPLNNFVPCLFVNNLDMTYNDV